MKVENLESWIHLGGLLECLAACGEITRRCADERGVVERVRVAPAARQCAVTRGAGFDVVPGEVLRPCEGVQRARCIGTESEVELMRHGDHYPNYPSYGVASYYKPATVLVALRGVLGPEIFHKAFTEYIHRWAFKHPAPYDFFHTFEDVSGKDLSWFWRTWFFETWKLDQAIDTVTTVGDSLDIVVENRGRAVMPVRLAVTRTNGQVERVTLPVETWFTGVRRRSVRVARQPAVKTIEIDPEKEFPDIDRSNQVWPR